MRDGRKTVSQSRTMQIDLALIDFDSLGQECFSRAVGDEIVGA